MLQQQEKFFFRPSKSAHGHEWMVFFGLHKLKLLLSGGVFLRFVKVIGVQSKHGLQRLSARGFFWTFARALIRSLQQNQQDQFHTLVLSSHFYRRNK